MKQLYKLITPFVILIIAGLLIYYIINANRTVYNPPDAAGNTAGNLFNGGLYREYDGRIYFSNINDNGTLYSMDFNLDNFKKINDDRTGYINAVGSYIFYSRMNNKKQDNDTPSVFALKSVGINRINLNGGNLKNLFADPAGVVNVYGNLLYYQHYNSEDGLKLYKVSIDGTGDEKISNDPVLPATIKNNTLYFTGTKENHWIYSMDLENGSISTVYEENCYGPVFHNNYIYFMSLSDNYSIYRVELNGDNPTRIVGERCSTYNITDDGSYIYYQVDDNKNNRICKMNLLTGEETTLKEGDYKNINIAGNHVFFTDFEGNKAYYVTAGVGKMISRFNPPVRKKK